MKHIVFDLEATCWSEGSTPERMEIIEIGAAKLSEKTYNIESVFSTFVKPIKEIELSDFCRKLTSIRQSDVDSAPEFPQAMKKFLDWIDNDEATFCSWGAYDITQIRIDCRRHRLPEPEFLNNHINLKS